MDSHLIYKIAISRLQGVGPVNIKKLIAYTGSIEGVFKEKKQQLLKIPGIGKSHLSKLNQEEAMDQASEELEFIEKNRIQTLFYLDQEYPKRLLNCPDAPILLYYKGTVDFNSQAILSIVGTRNATDYGRELCYKLIEDLTQRGHSPLIVSGLAYGIDIYAHKAALKHQLPTLAVLGHGLDVIYPAQHRSYANEIKERGALVTEFPSRSIVDPKNFVKRNRIIAGIADATIVVESAKKGGSLVTANIANSYNRDVFAFPGRTSDNYSSGCNYLIKSNQAHLVEGVEDLEYILGWNTNKTHPQATQQKLFVVHSEEEEKILAVLGLEKQTSIDQICVQTSMPMSRVSSLLLKMEFEGTIRAHPGKIYSLNH